MGGDSDVSRAEAEVFVNYYKRHLGDYAKDTGHLSALEHGVFNLLLDWYYASEQPIPAGKVNRIAKAGNAIERAAVESVLNDFFRRDGDFWRNKRADEEISKQQDKSRKAAESAEKRWQNAHEKEMPLDCESNAIASKTHSVGNATRARVPLATSHKPQEEKSKSAAGAAVHHIQTDPKAELWARWKELPDSGGGAYLSKLIRDFRDEQRVLEAVERTLDHAPADPKAFIVGVLRKAESAPAVFGTGPVL